MDNIAFSGPKYQSYQNSPRGELSMAVTPNMEQKSYFKRKRGTNMAAGTGSTCLISQNEIITLENHLSKDQLQSLHQKFPNLSTRNSFLKQEENQHDINFVDFNKTHLNQSNLYFCEKQKIRHFSRPNRKLKNNEAPPRRNSVVPKNMHYNEKEKPSKLFTTGIENGDPTHSEISQHGLINESSIQIFESERAEMYGDRDSSPLQLPVIDGATQASRKRNDRGRFKMSKETQLEFTIRDSEIPDKMKQVIPNNQKYVNYVDMNRRSPSNQKDIDKIFYLCKIKNSIENAQKNKIKLESIEAGNKVKMNLKLNRWNQFRARRECVVDRFINMKKQQRALEDLLKIHALAKAVKHSFEFLEEEKRARDVRTKICFLSVKLYMKQAVLLKKYGGLTEKLKHRLRHALLLGYRTQHDHSSLRAMEIIHHSLNTQYLNFSYRAGKTRLDELVIFMQKKFRNRFVYKSAKIDMISQYWDDFLANILFKATKKRNNKIKILCEYVYQIRPEIKAYVIKKFVEQIQKLSWINFYETRKIERAEYCDELELDLQIYKLKEWLRQQRSDAKVSNLLSDETKEKSAITSKDMKDFQLENQLNLYNTAFISDFKDIYWLDPFAANSCAHVGQAPGLAKRKSKQLSRIKRSSKALLPPPVVDPDQDEIPRKIFSFKLPSKQLLVNMMRACVAVKKVEDLWMFDTNY